MNRTLLLSALFAMLAGCAGANYRTPRATAVPGAADVGRSALPATEELMAQPCEGLELSSALAKFTEMSLWEVWEELARVGAAGVPPLGSVDTELLPRGLLRGSGTAPALCAGVHQDPADGTILVLPEIWDKPRQAQTAEVAPLLAGARLAQGARFWARVDRGRLVNLVGSDGPQLPVPRELQLMLVPLGRGSLIRLDAPRFGAHSGVLLQRQPEEATRPDQTRLAALSSRICWTTGSGYPTARRGY